MDGRETTSAPFVGALATHKDGVLDSRFVTAVSEDASKIKIKVGTIESDWVPSENYDYQKVER